MKEVVVVALVGRAAEFGSLRELAEQVASGQGGAALVTGEPGIGKSNLITASLAGMDNRGCRVYTATCYEQPFVFPMEALLDAFGVGIGAAASEGDEPAADLIRASYTEVHGMLYGNRVGLVTPRDSLSAVADRLVTLVHRLCAVSPTVLVVDDAQWTDEASLGILYRLSRVLNQLPLLLVVAVRPVPSRPEVETLCDVVISAGALCIELGPLDEHQAAAMVQELIGVPPGPAFAEQLNAASGNPLYLRELVDCLVRESRLSMTADQVELMGHPSDLPATLPAAIKRRLRFLSGPATAALQVASVLGPVFSVADLAVVTGQQANDLVTIVGEGVTAGVLVEHDPSALAFRHGLVHQALYSGMASSVRAALHRQAAEGLSRQGGPPEQVAGQLLAAAEPVDAWVIDWLADSAPALCHRAPQVAVDLLRRARAGLEGPEPRRDRLDADLALVHLQLGNNEQVLTWAGPVLKYTGDGAMAGTTSWTLAYALSRMGKFAEAVTVVDEALGRGDVPLLWSARLRARRALTLFTMGRYDDARGDAERAVEDGTRAGDRIATGYAEYVLAMTEIYDRRNVAPARDIFDRALAALGEEPQTSDLLLLLMVGLGSALGALGRPAEADRIFGRASLLADRGTRPRQAYVLMSSALYGFYRGRWDVALADVDASRELPLDDVYQEHLGGLVAIIAVHRGDRTIANELVSGAKDVPLVDSEARMLIEYLLVAWALVAEQDGDPVEALTRLRSTYDPDATLEFSRLGIISTLWLPDVVRIAMAVGKPAVAAAAAKACSREAAAQTRPTSSAAALHCQGLLDADPAVLHSSAELFEQTGYPLFRAQALENAAVVHAQLGELMAARSAYYEAIDIYHDLEAAWDIRRADLRLRDYNISRGVRGPRRRPSIGWEALTPTEQKVAHLVAAGLSNPEIASTLFLSPRTIEAHVSHILTKLNAKSRLQVARMITPP
jgi:DNA-binding CsgD family transcriptional regulator